MFTGASEDEAPSQPQRQRDLQQSKIAIICALERNRLVAKGREFGDAEKVFYWRSTSL